jgi:hypothetical protein
MPFPPPIQLQVDDIEKALSVEAYYPAIMVALTLPDVCAALESPNGRTIGEKYKQWYKTYGARISSVITADHMWKFRCGFVHQGRLGNKLPYRVYSSLAVASPAHITPLEKRSGPTGL